MNGNDNARDQKIRIEEVTWLGGRGLCILINNKGKDSFPVDFDYVVLTAKHDETVPKEFIIPFSFKYNILSRASSNNSSKDKTGCFDQWEDPDTAIFLPLNNMGLPRGEYPVTLSFKKKVMGELEKEIESFSPLTLKILEFSSPSEEPSRKLDMSRYLEKVKRKSGTGGEELQAYFRCISKDGHLFINIRTDSVQSDRQTAGRIYVPYYMIEDQIFYKHKSYRALDWLKIKITTNNKSQIIYYPFPVSFTLKKGEECDFSICLKDVQWDVNSLVEITHLTKVEGDIGSAFNIWSQLIFSEDKDIGED